MSEFREKKQYANPSIELKKKKKKETKPKRRICSKEDAKSKLRIYREKTNKRQPYIHDEVSK